MTPWLESIIARGDRRSTGADHGLTGRVRKIRELASGPQTFLGPLKDRSIDC
jgi:hypothetical protein